MGLVTHLAIEGLLFEYFLYRFGLEIEVPLYFTSELPPRIHEFRETEGAVFSDVPSTNP
jgi:hypothetical protein